MNISLIDQFFEKKYKFVLNSLVKIIVAGLNVWVKKLLPKADMKEIIMSKIASPEERMKIWRSKTMQIQNGISFRQRGRDVCLHAIEHGIL